MTNPPALTRSCPVALYDAAASHVLARCLSGSYRGSLNKLELINYPDTASRDVLAARHKALVGTLKGFDRKTVGEAIFELLNCFNQYQGKASAEDKKAMKDAIAKYVMELQHAPQIPTWACLQACDAIRLAKSEASHLSRTFPPSTIEVRALAQTYVAPVHGELQQIGDVLQGVQAPPQLSPEERKALGAKLQTLGDELRGRERQQESARERPVSSFFDNSRFILREWGRAALVECAPGVPVSRSLADKLAR